MTSDLEKVVRFFAIVAGVPCLMHWLLLPQALSSLMMIVIVVAVVDVFIVVVVIVVVVILCSNICVLFLLLRQCSQTSSISLLHCFPRVRNNRIECAWAPF